MDLDELLARQLQHAELAEAPQAPSGGRTRQEQEKVQLLGAIESGLDLCSKCEDEELQALALSLIPLDELADSAKRTKQLNQQEGSNAAGGRVLDVQDYLACELMQWFKRSFFKWVNAPPCAFCGSKTTGAGVQPPNQEERAFQASRTEIYCCSVCSSITRFPRFNDVGKLLETRKGRCGEFANAALLCCRAIGLTARYIWDSEDHVWTEYWSDALQRWVHMDFCEAAWDKSLLERCLVMSPGAKGEAKNQQGQKSMLQNISAQGYLPNGPGAPFPALPDLSQYEGGWKKKLKYVLAICPTSVVDVTARYTRQYAVVSQRRAVPDSWLQAQAQTVTQQLRASLPPGVLRALELRDVSEQLELLGRATEQSPLSAEEAAGLKGRQTGDDAWKRARGEDGDACKTSGLQPESSRSSTPAATMWRPLPMRQEHDEYVDVPSGPTSVCARAGRLMGGACRASGENSGEEAVNAFDGGVLTKWLDFGGGGLGGSAWLEFRFMDPEGASAQTSSPLLSYDIVSANDSPERDPRDWVVEGLSLQDEQAGNLTDGWQVLDVRKEVTFTDRHQLRSFACTFPHKASSSAQQQQAGSLAAGGEHAMPSPPALAHAHWRRFRLRITSTADPAAANSVQLAAWNLFGLPQPDPLNLTLLPSCSSLGAAGESGLEACQQAAHQVIQAKLACLLTTQQVELLLKVMANVANHPEDPRYRRLRASKVLSLASSPEALVLLLATGFRPLVSDGPALFFVLEAGEHAVHRAACIVKVLGSSV